MPCSVSGQRSAAGSKRDDYRDNYRSSPGRRPIKPMEPMASKDKEEYMYSFFATISRMKYIERWALMRSSRPENLSEHALEVASIAHVLCTIGNLRYGRSLDADRAAVIGLYHDATEIITGDMPTPVKYHNRDIRRAYKDVEEAAARRLIELLPEDLRGVPGRPGCTGETFTGRVPPQTRSWSASAPSPPRYSAPEVCVPVRRRSEASWALPRIIAQKAPTAEAVRACRVSMPCRSCARASPSRCGRTWGIGA